MFLLIALLCHGAVAQEINCSVQVVSNQVEGSEKTVFNAMQQSLYEFVNNRKWTSDKFRAEERIECSILINISNRISTEEFEGSIQIQASRPVFNSSYKSSLFSHKDDDFRFRYLQFDILDFSETAHISNLTSVVAFYLYIILGLDYDSFAPEGGTVYFQKAMTIVNNAQGAPEAGWKAFENQFNRYWMAQNYVSQRFGPLRQCFYQYHRQGFDKMADNTTDARAQITEALELLRPLYRNFPNAFNLRLFFNAKVDEIVSVYKGATPEEKNRITQLLNEINPGNTTKYLKIKEGR